MDMAGEQTFTSAAFSGKQYGRVAGRRLRGYVEQCRGLGRRSEELVLGRQPFKARFQRTIFLLERLDFERARHRLADCCALKGLGR